MTQTSNAAPAPAPKTCTCGAVNIESCLCGTTQADWFAAGQPVESPVTESYSVKRSRIEAENDAFRKRGSKLARKLLALHTARMDAHRDGPKAEAVAIARFEGACEALAALYGYTPHAWEMTAIAPWQRAAGRPVVSIGLGGNQALLAWEAALAEDIDAELATLLS